VNLWRVLTLLWLSACTESHRNLVSDPRGAPDTSPRDASAPADANAIRDARITTQSDADAVGARCGTHPCSCDDGIDNDDDGLIDGLDPECTGAYDDDEASFATGLPNKLMACRDCFWDSNSGSGDDGCRYPYECLTDPAFVGKSNCPGCAVTAECTSNCQARTPNGCDCFGCCEVPAPDGGSVHIQLLEGCSLSQLADTVSCPRCEPHPECKNDCGRCELCLGKTLADLPADCAGEGPGYACEGELAVCSRTSPCDAGYYCHQGCCLVDLL